MRRPVCTARRRAFSFQEVKRMKKILVTAVMSLMLAIAVSGQATPVAPTTKLKVGDAAPDFSLTDTAGNAVKLSDFRGKKNVVLAFYVLAFTGG